MDNPLVPHINAVEDASYAISACKYPPGDIRGAGPRRPMDYGRNEADYFASADEATFVLLMIETIGAVAAIDAILTSEGLDGIIFSPGDLAMSMGLHGDPSRVEVKTAIYQVMAMARAAGIPFSSGVPITSDPTEAIGVGAQPIGLSDDQASVMNHAQESLERFQDIIWLP